MGRTMAQDPLQGFRFRIEIEGISALGFTEASGLNTQTDVVEYREGGYSYTRKLPGRQKVSNVSLSRGALADATLYNWYVQSLGTNDFRKTVTIYEQDRNGTDKRAWVLHETWAAQFDMPTLNSESDNVLIDKLVLEVEWVELVIK